jgi:hypothetical protein
MTFEPAAPQLGRRCWKCLDAHDERGRWGLRRAGSLATALTPVERPRGALSTDGGSLPYQSRRMPSIALAVGVDPSAPDGGIGTEAQACMGNW